MILAISTVQRPKNSPYLERLISSIRQDYAGEIHLVIGGKETAYTDKYQEGFVKHFIGKEEEQFANVIQKAAYGYYRCLTINRNEPCLVFEDDAELTENWHKKLEQLLTFIEQPMYVLSLLRPSDQAVPYPNIEAPSVQKFLYAAMLDYGTKRPPGKLPLTNIITYSNTTGIYYPATILQTRLPEFIQKFAAQGDTVHDIALGQYMFRYDLPLYIAVPSLCLPVDTSDTHLGADKRRAHTDYSDWDYTKL